MSLIDLLGTAFPPIICYAGLESPYFSNNSVYSPFYVKDSGGKFVHTENLSLEFKIRRRRGFWDASYPSIPLFGGVVPFVWK